VLQKLVAVQYDKKLFPLNNSEEIVKRYIVRKVGFAKVFDYGNQTAYGAHMHQSVEMGLHFLNNDGWGFDDLMSFFALRRYEMAVEADHKEASKFGCLRAANRTYFIQTDCTGDYKLDFVQFLNEDSEWGKLQRNEFRRIGFLHPF
jgi:hypothetical protein